MAKANIPVGDINQASATFTGVQSNPPAPAPEAAETPTLKKAPTQETATASGAGLGVGSSKKKQSKVTIASLRRKRGNKARANNTVQTGSTAGYGSNNPMIG